MTQPRLIFVRTLATIILASAIPSAFASTIILSEKDKQVGAKDLPNFYLGFNPETSNPALGISLGMKDASKWSWDVPFTVGPALPSHVTAGTSYKPEPALVPLAGETFKVRDDYSFSSGAYFYADAWWMPEVDLKTPLPNWSDSGITLNAHGSGAAGTGDVGAESVFHVPGHDPGTGFYRMAGVETPMLWSLDVNILNFIQSNPGLFSVPVSVAAGAADLAGFDLHAKGGAKATIYHTWGLLDYRLSGALDLVAPSAYGTWDYSVDGMLDYKVLLSTLITYSPGVELTYDAPLIDPGSLEFYDDAVAVGSIYSEELWFSTEYHYRGTTEVEVDMYCATHQLQCRMDRLGGNKPSDFVRKIDGAIDFDTYKNNLPSVPEPGSVALLATILTALAIRWALSAKACRRSASR